MLSSNTLTVSSAYEKNYKNDNINQRVVIESARSDSLMHVPLEFYLVLRTSLCCLYDEMIDCTVEYEVKEDSLEIRLGGKAHFKWCHVRS